MNDESMNKKALVSGVWYTASNFIVKALGALTLPLFTRLLTDVEFGDYNNYLSWQSIILIIASLNLGSTLMTARFDYKNFDRYIFSVLTLSTFTAGICTAVLNVFGDAFTGYFGMSRLTMNLMMAYIIFYVAIDLYQARERYKFEYKHTVGISLLLSFSTVLVSLGLVLSMEDRLTGRILGNVLPTILIGFVIYLYFIKKGKSIEFSAWKYALPICLPYIPHLLSMTVLGSTDKIMITQMCDSRSTALYSLAYSCGSIITLLLNSINTAYSPWLGNKLNEKDYDSIRKMAPTYILTFCTLSLGAILLAPEILYIMGGSSYMEAVYVMPPVAMGCVCQFLYTMFVNIEQYMKNTKWMAVASVSAALLNLVLNWIFIPIYGYVAAAYTTLASYLWLLIAHMIIVKTMKMDKVYDCKFVLITVLVMISISIGITFLYSNTVIRWITFGIYAVLLVMVLYKKKDMIKKILKRSK